MSPEPVGRFHQMMSDAGFVRGVSGVVDDVQLRVGPGAVEIPRAGSGAHHIVATLHDHARNAMQEICIPQQLPFVEETAMVEIVVLDPREGECEPGLRGVGDVVGLR